MDLAECNARREWASKHLAALREAVREFERSDPYEIVHVYEPTAYASELHIKPTPVPTEISFMAGDVVHNLRSCLDHLIWQLTLINHPAPPPFPLDSDAESWKWRSLFFPYQSKEDENKPWPPKSLWGVSNEIRQFIKELQPYVAADNPHDATLWKMQELSNVDKHRLPLMAVPSLAGTGTVTVTIPTGGVNSRVVDVLRVPAMLEGPTLLLRVLYDTVPLLKPMIDIELRIEVTFHDKIGIGRSFAVVPLLDMMEAMVIYIQQRAGLLQVSGSAG